MLDLSERLYSYFKKPEPEEHKPHLQAICYYRRKDLEEKSKSIAHAAAFIASFALSVLFAPSFFSTLYIGAFSNILLNKAFCLISQKYVERQGYEEAEKALSSSDFHKQIMDQKITDPDEIVAKHKQRLTNIP